MLHLEARERSDESSRWLSAAAVACAALALRGGETALGLFGYVAAYELIGRREPLALRLRALVPWGALLFAYAAMYKGLVTACAASAGTWIRSGSRAPTSLLVGAVLAVLPGAASIPGDRVLFTLLARAQVALFGLVHVVLAPLLLFAFGAWHLASSRVPADERAVAGR